MIIGGFALWTESGCYTRTPQVVWCVLLDEPAFALVVNTNEKTTAASMPMSTFFALKFFVVIVLKFYVYTLLFFCRCFFLTMRSYDVFLLIPRKIPDSSPTYMDRRPIFGQIAETGQNVVRKVTCST